MQKLKDLLIKEKIEFSEIANYLDNDDCEKIYMILNNIDKFDLEDKKNIIKKIIIATNNKKLIDKACLCIKSYIEYECEYYREILRIISKKDISSTWISEIEKDLLNDLPKVIQEVLEDFSLNKPLNVEYDLLIINKLLENYDEVRYLEKVNISDVQAISICNKLNYVITIYSEKIFRFYIFIIEKIGLKKEQYKEFIDIFFFNYPYLCKKEISNYSFENSTGVIEYIKDKIETLDKEDKLKYNMTIFKPNIQRMKEYKKYLSNENKEINKRANEMSVFRNFFSVSTILYSNMYGTIIKRENNQILSESKMTTISHEYPYPLEYILDPIAYMHKVDLVIRPREE